jgi:hypothetical protein
VLIDGGASHNFIDLALVKRRACYHPKLHVDGLAVEPPKMNKLLLKFRVQKSSQAPWSLVHSSNFRISITRRGIVIDELV